MCSLRDLRVSNEREHWEQGKDTTRPEGGGGGTTSGGGAGTSTPVGGGTLVCASASRKTVETEWAMTVRLREAGASETGAVATN